jgi:WD40 repeat protein
MKNYTLLLLFFILLHPIISRGESFEKVFQTGHGTKIRKVVFSKDSKFLASCAHDNTIIIWEVESGKQFANLIGHNNVVNSIAFSPSQPGQLISCSVDGSINVWNYLEGKLINTINTGMVLREIQYSSKNPNHLFACGDGLIKIDLGTKEFTKLIFIESFKTFAIDYQDNILLVGLSNLELVLFAEGNIHDRLGDGRAFGRTAKMLLFDKKDNCFLAINEQNALLKFKVTNGKIEEKWKFNPPRKYLGIDAFCHTGSQFIYTGGERRIYLVNKKNFLTNSYLAGIENISFLATNEDESFLVSVNRNNEIVLMTYPQMKMIKSIKGEYERISDLKFTTNNQSLFMTGFERSLRLWNLPQNTVVNSIIPEELTRKLSGWKGLTLHIDSVTEKEAFFKYAEYKKSKDGDYISSVIYFDFIWDIKKNILTKIASSKRLTLIDFDATDLTVPEIKYFLFAVYKSFKESEALKYQINTNNRPKTDVVANDYNELYNLYVVGNPDGTIGLFQGKESKAFLANAALLNQSDFLFTDSLGNYFGTKSAVKNVNIRYQGKLFSMDVLDAIYNRPDIILSKIPFYQNIDQKTLEAAINNRRKRAKLDVNSTPESILSQIPKFEAMFSYNDPKRECLVSISLKDSPNAISLVKIRVNGILVVSEKIDQQTKIFSFPIAIIEKENIVEVVVEDEKGLNSLPQSFSIISSIESKEGSNLFFLGIGGSQYAESTYNLTYADKDVKDMANLLGKKGAFKNVFIETITEQRNNIDTIMAVSKRLFANVHPEDVVLIYYAGHGVLDNQYNYYLATFDMDFYNPVDKGLSYEKLTEILGNNSSRYRICLLDACHSGEIDKSEVENQILTIQNNVGDVKFRSVGKGLTLKNSATSGFELAKQLFNDVKENDGSVVISASGGLEFAIENSKLKNGVFTYSLIEGIDKRMADYNGDSKISLKELENFLPARVYNLTSGKQRANTRTENLLLDFRIR